MNALLNHPGWLAAVGIVLMIFGAVLWHKSKRWEFKVWAALYALGGVSFVLIAGLVWAMLSI